MGTESEANFRKKALFTDYEVVLCLDEWLRAIESNEMKIELCRPARMVLHDCVEAIKEKVLVGGLPGITKPLAEYVLDIFEDRLQLGIVAWKSDAVFNEEGEPEDGNFEYSLIESVDVPYWSVEEWGKANDVKPATVRQWASRGRISTKKEGRDLRISAIQYKPEALYADKERPVRFKMPGHLPEAIVTKYPSLRGNVLDIIFSGKKDGALFSVIVLSIPEENGNPKVMTLLLREKERDAMLRALNESVNDKNTLERRYSSPLPDARWNEQKREPVIPTTEEDVRAVAAMKITGMANGTFSLASHGPAFTIQADGVCEIKGRFVFPTGEGKEERLLAAIFKDESDGFFDAFAEMKESSLVSIGRWCPWSKRILFVNTMKVGETADDKAVMSFLMQIPLAVRRTLGCEARLVLVSLPCGDTGAEKKMRLLEACGYARIPKRGGGTKGKQDVFYGFKN